MAHFARLDENNTVIDVLVIENQDILDENNQESEQKGIEFLKNLFGQDTVWVQTSYNHNFRVRYAVIGGKYDPIRDIFIREKPFSSWVFDEYRKDWVPPIPFPVPDGYMYFWNEELQNYERYPNSDQVYAGTPIPDYEIE